MRPGWHRTCLCAESSTDTAGSFQNIDPLRLPSHAGNGIPLGGVGHDVNRSRELQQVEVEMCAGVHRAWQKLACKRLVGSMAPPTFSSV